MIKTVTTVSGKNTVTFPEFKRYFWVRNIGTTSVFISALSDIAANADDTVTINAGDVVRLDNSDDKNIYVIGAGMLEIHAQDIVDCPFKVAPVSGGGEIVNNESSYTLTNAADYPIIGLNMYGKSTQNGTPTPENPVNIVSVGDGGSVEITACGKNLLNPTLQTKTNNGVTCTNNGDGTYTLNGTAQKDAYFSFGAINNAVVGTNYRLTCSPNPSKSTYIAYFEVGASGYEYNNSTAIGKKIIVTIAIKANVTVNNMILKPMITTDLTATYDDFEPYKGTTANITSALPLCGIPVDSDGNYTDSNGQQWICDELIYNADGTGKVVKYTEKIDSYNGETISGAYISTTGSLTTGATIIYQLAEPQEIELTAAEMAQLRELQTFDGVTNITNDSGADMDVSYCTNKMLSEYVFPITTGLQKQIDELKAAVISLGGNV